MHIVIEILCMLNKTEQQLDKFTKIQYTVVVFV